MDGETCKTCGGNCMFCKVTQIVAPLLIIALTWTMGMWFEALYSRIAITVFAVAIMGMMFCPCRKGGADAMGTDAAAKPMVKPAAKAAAKPMAA